LRKKNKIYIQINTHQFALGPLQDVLFHGLRGHQAEHLHLRRALPDAVRARHGLEVVLGVPVFIKINDCN
jgi:hypothetical protein